MAPCTALILDDEIDNITLLKILLNKYCKSVATIYTATTVAEATALYLEHVPDILYLDIKLGNNETAFSFVEKITDFKPEIIFISSYEEYAIKAINIQALGYIVKPIEVSKLVNITNKAICCLENKKKLESVKTQSQNGLIDFIAIPSTSKIDVINPSDIVYLEADGRYTIFHLKEGTKKTASRNLGEYEKQLDKNLFFRIHHTYIINLKTVSLINKAAGNYVELINNVKLPIAKRRQAELNRFLKIH